MNKGKNTSSTLVSNLTVPLEAKNYQQAAALASSVSVSSSPSKSPPIHRAKLLKSATITLMPVNSSNFKMPDGNYF